MLFYRLNGKMTMENHFFFLSLKKYLVVCQVWERFQCIDFVCEWNESWAWTPFFLCFACFKLEIQKQQRHSIILWNGNRSSTSSTGVLCWYGSKSVHKAVNLIISHTPLTFPLKVIIIIFNIKKNYTIQFPIECWIFAPLCVFCSSRTSHLWADTEYCLTAQQFY